MGKSIYGYRLEHTQIQIYKLLPLYTWTTIPVGPSSLLWPSRVTEKETGDTGVAGQPLSSVPQTRRRRRCCCMPVAWEELDKPLDIFHPPVEEAINLHEFCLNHTNKYTDYKLTTSGKHSQ